MDRAPRRGGSGHAAAEAIQDACDQSDQKKAGAWIGMLPKGFLAMPAAFHEHKDIAPALNGKGWAPQKKAWIDPRGL